MLNPELDEDSSPKKSSNDILELLTSKYQK